MKTYYFRFGFGDPRPYTGLSPSFIFFTNVAGSEIAPPSISESEFGSGIYKFSYGVSSPISFLIDAATISPGVYGRYVAGSLDPADRADEYGNTLMALGTTAIAIGTTTQAIATTILAGSLSLAISVPGIGSTASSFGNSSTDPVDLFGYMKRIQELLEGNETYIKPSGSLTMFSRGGSITLRQKNIANSVTTVVKT